MALDGTWEIRVSTPMGVNTQTLDLVTDGSAVSGTAHTMGGDVPIEHGLLTGDVLGFTLNVTVPFPMPIAFELTVTGDSLKGTSRAGGFPPSPVVGERTT